ncbi:ribbon-helix-helix protein, CopG family [Erwinia sorbitola]|uniref:Ribbon-helix-helix protein, CopG family n=1 Tax=Erwinia sorbitola TaxID=2681984 RepID=A0A6I6EL97_9GAMM|nr:ribbon-helix-helix protein, CopG family [Erwinia sorbitola]QGU87066.1 ribbon-helix-helix protein, CopG family [Erwinia sorbitola]
MAQSRVDTQKKSDERRGVRPKSYKLPISIIELIEALSKEEDMPQSAVISKAVELFAESLKK